VTVNDDTVSRNRYDQNGNRQSYQGATAADTASGLYDNQDRLLRWGNTRFEYAPTGALLRRIAGTDTTLYTYDALGNLIRVITPGHDTVTYVVDGLNRRIGRKVNGAWRRGWLYAGGLGPVAELDEAGAVLNRYVYGVDGQSPSLMQRGSATYRLIVDYLGSVRGVVNAATGAVVERRDYDAWGNESAGNGPAVQVLGFAGGLADSATGLVRFGARDYDPAPGRWTAKDPLGFGGGDANLYAYCGNDPVGAVDPSGTDVNSDLNGVAGAGDGLTCGWASKLRNKYFGYNDVDPNSAAFGEGRKSARDFVLGMALSAGGGALLAKFEGALVAILAPGAQGLRYSEDAAALVQLAKRAEHTGVNQEEAATLLRWAEEYNVKPALNHIETEH
jgi:RHS repeat-associated protein